MAEELEELVKVYNFEVQDWHAYYVSEYGVLVHNTYKPKGEGWYNGKLSKKASEMKPLEKGSKQWNQAIDEMKKSVSKGEKFQVKVNSSSDAKSFLQEAQGNMNRYKAHTQSSRATGVPKYPKGYEQHVRPEGGLGDSPHIKYYNNGTDGHIFYDIPN